MPDQATEHPEFIAETGKVCAAWALLEMITDRILWGVLRVDSKIGGMISLSKDLAARWPLIVNNSEGVVAPEDLEMFRRISRHVQLIAIDRNIAVHGTIVVTPNNKTYAIVTKGTHAGKLNEIDVARIRTILANIRLVSIEARRLGDKYKWLIEPPPMEPINLDWAMPIEGFP